ncbi:hypothetical protein AAVH_24146 [Aphelenchoides avenae]|nr:hypothetical protein AAVH_24146 [Aphelenchus avenae]
MGEQTEAFVFWNCTTPGCGGTAMMKVGEKRLSDLEPHNAECVQAHSTPGNGEGTHAMNQPGGKPSSGEPAVKHQRKASPGRSTQAQDPTNEADERQSRASPRPTHGMRTRSRSRGRDSPSPELGAVRRGRSSSKSREDIRGVSPSIAAMRTRSSSQSATPPTRPGPSSSTVAAAHKPQIVVGPKPREVSTSAANRFVKPMTIHMAPHVKSMGSLELEEEDEEEQAEEKEQDDEEQVDEEAPADEGSDVRRTEAGKDATEGAEDGAKTAAEPESDVAEELDEEQVEEELDEEEVMLVEDEEMFAGLQETIANMVSTSSGRGTDKQTPEPPRPAEPCRKSPMEGSGSTHATSDAEAAAHWQQLYVAEKKARETAERQRDHYKRELAKEAAGRKEDQAKVLRKIKDRAGILRRCRELSSSRPDVPRPAPVTTPPAIPAPKSTAEVSTMTAAPPETRSALTQTPAIAKPKPPPAKKDASTQMVARAKSSFGGHLLREETSNHPPKQKRAAFVQCAPETRHRATDTDDLPQPPAPPVALANVAVVPREPNPVMDDAIDVQQFQAADDEFGDVTIAELWEIVKAQCNGRTLEDTFGRQG